MAGSHVDGLDLRHPADQRQAILRHRAETGLACDDPLAPRHPLAFSAHVRECLRLALRRNAIISVSSTAKRDSMRPTIGTAGTRYRETSRVWVAAAVTIEATHITITMPARVKNRERRRRTAVTVQNMTAITKAVDNASNRWGETLGDRTIGRSELVRLAGRRLNRPAVPRHDVGHVRHVVGRHRYGRVESVGRPCDRGPIGHLTDELARVGQRPVAHGGQEDAPIGCGRAGGIPVSSAMSRSSAVSNRHASPKNRARASDRLRAKSAASRAIVSSARSPAADTISCRAASLASTMLR